MTRDRPIFDFGVGVLHLDVLRARLRRRQRMLIRLLLCALLVIGIAVARPLLMTWLLGQGTIVITSAPTDVVVTLDGAPASGSSIRALSGQHTLAVQRPGFYAATLPVVVARDQTTALELPRLRPRPIAQLVPLPGVGARWISAAPDALDGWRLATALIEANPTPASFGAPARDPRSDAIQLQLTELGLSRQSSLEAFPAADERVTPRGTSWAAYDTASPGRAGWAEPAAHLSLRWPGGSLVITPTAPINGLWWGPDGQTLVVALQHGAGQDLTIWTPADKALAPPFVTVPGQVVALRWHPKSPAVVVLSRQPSPRGALASMGAAASWDATLILAPSAARPAPSALRLSTPPPAALGMVPMAWSDDALLWSSTNGSSWDLERVPLSSALPSRLGPLPFGTLALQEVADHTLRLLVLENATLTLRDGATGAILLTLDDVRVTPGMNAAWQGDTLLLGTEQELWRLTFAAGALSS